MSKKSTVSNRTSHDSFFRGSMMNIEIARDFLTAHLGQQILKRIDLSSLKLEPSTFIDDKHKELRSDILYSAKIDNKQTYLYVLVEHQSRVDEFMAFRVLNYSCQIWQMHLDRLRQTKSKIANKKLPSIVPLVIYNGKVSPYGHSTKLLDCFTDPNLVKKFILEQFKLVDLTIEPDQELVRHQRAAVMELLEKHIRARNILPIIEFMCNADVWGQIKNLENGKYLHFALKYLVDKGETTTINKAISLIAQRLPDKEEKIMTIADGLRKQGKLQGSQETKIEIARNLLAMGMDYRAVAKATKLPSSKIKALH